MMGWQAVHQNLPLRAMFIIGLASIAVSSAVEDDGIQEALPEFHNGRPAHWWKVNRDSLENEYKRGWPAASNKRIQLAVLKPGRCIAVKLQAPAGSQIEFHASATPLPPVKSAYTFTPLAGPTDASSCPNGFKVAVIRSDHLPQGVLPPSLFKYQPPKESIYMRLMEDLQDGRCRETNTGPTNLPTSGEDPLGQYYFLPKDTCRFLNENTTAMQPWAPNESISSSLASGLLLKPSTKYVPSCEAAKGDLEKGASPPITPYQPKPQKGSSPAAPHACANATYYVYLYGCGAADRTPPYLVQARVSFTPVKNAETCYSKADEFFEVVTKFIVVPVAGIPLALWASMRIGQFLLISWQMMCFAVRGNFGGGGCGCCVPGMKHLWSKVRLGCLGRKRPEKEAQLTGLPKLRGPEDYPPDWLCGGLKAITEAYSTVNSANGYSRWYTILLSTSAALLIAAIVWQPPLEGPAVKQLDYNYFDFVLSPTKTPSSDRDPVLLWYWLKVMCVSAVIGLIVRTALMYNLSVPDDTVRAENVRKCRRRITPLHKVFSFVAQLGLWMLIGCYCFHALMRVKAWEYTRAYLYILAVLSTMNILALAFYIQYTFIESADQPLQAKVWHAEDLAGQRTASSGCLTKPASCCKHVLGALKSLLDWLAKCCMTCTGVKWLAKTKFGGCIQRCFVEPVWEEPESQDRNGPPPFRYSAWFLVSVFLAMIMTVFWFWYFLAEAKGWISCMEDPLQCFDGLVSRSLNIPSGMGDIQTTAQTIAETYNDTMHAYQGVLQPVLGALNLLNGFVLTRTDDDFALSGLSEWAAKLGDLGDKADMLLYADGNQLLSRINDRLVPIKENLRLWRDQSKTAFKWGRYVGYFISFICALMSLWRIVATFKEFTKSQHKKRWHRLEAQQAASAAGGPGGEAQTGAAAGAYSRAARRASRGKRPEDQPPLQLQKKQIQDMLQSEYSVFFIGQSVTMFGVLSSMMYLQIWVIGSLLVAALTVLFHPRFWMHIFFGYHLWVPVLSLALIIPANIWGVQWFFGSKLFSNGERIKKPGAWMTYYITSSTAFVVLGLLWAFWRFFWVLVKTLLYTVACLDRNLLGCFPPDGPHAAFVATAKLEEAWMQLAEKPPPDDYMTPACCPPCCPPPKFAKQRREGGGCCCCCPPPANVHSSTDSDEVEEDVEGQDVHMMKGRTYSDRDAGARFAPPVTQEMAAKVYTRSASSTARANGTAQNGEISYSSSSDRDVSRSGESWRDQ